MSVCLCVCVCVQAAVVPIPSGLWMSLKRLWLEAVQWERQQNGQGRKDLTNGNHRCACSFTVCSPHAVTCPHCLPLTGSVVSRCQRHTCAREYWLSCVSYITVVSVSVLRVHSITRRDPTPSQQPPISPSTHIKSDDDDIVMVTSDTEQANNTASKQQRPQRGTSHVPDGQGPAQTQEGGTQQQNGWGPAGAEPEPHVVDLPSGVQVRLEVAMTHTHTHACVRVCVGLVFMHS